MHHHCTHFNIQFLGFWENCQNPIIGNETFPQKYTSALEENLHVRDNKAFLPILMFFFCLIKKNFIEQSNC